MSGEVRFWGERVYDELQEQNHLPEENKRQTSQANAVQPPEYCTYPVFLLLCNIFGFHIITGFTALLKLFM